MTPHATVRANTQLARPALAVLRDCDERLRLIRIQIPTIRAASIPATGDKSAATSRPMVSAIATVTTSHQNPNPRSLPIVAMNRDLTRRTGDLISSRSQSTGRDNKDLTERAEAVARARTQPTALESLARSQRNGINDRGRSRPPSFLRGPPWFPRRGYSPLVFDFAGSMSFLGQPWHTLARLTAVLPLSSGT